jgi:hypothetical protein
MNQQLVVILLVGLAVSAYSLDLSHAKRSTEIEPRFFSFFNDLYAQVIYPPLNHVVTSLALLGAQLLAGISENGLPQPNGRTLYLTEDQLRGFWSSLWNDAIKPPIENALTSASLMVAQVLAGVGLNGISLPGKRDLTEAQMRGFFDDLANGLLNGLQATWTNVLQGPIEGALQSAALMAAQLLAGIGTNGISLPGKRDLTEAQTRAFLDDFTNALNSVFSNVIQKPLEGALQSVALMAAQLLAGIGTNGIDLSSLLGLPGKRDLTEAQMRGFLDDLTNALNSVFTEVIQKPLENALQSTALMAAQLLAGIGTNGIDLSSLLGLPGKRDLKPELRGPIIDGLVNHASGLFNDQVKPLLESALNNAVLNLAGILANFSENGLGRR